MSNCKYYAANQPLMLGGGIYKWARYRSVDVLSVMPQAQYSKFCDHSRIRLKDNIGNPFLTIFDLLNRSYQSLDNVYLSNPTRNVTKLEKTLRNAYSGCKEPELMTNIIGLISAHKDESLASINMHVMGLIAENLLSGKTRVVVSPSPTGDSPTEWVVEQGTAINCTQYVGGYESLSDYIDLSYFEEAGIIHNHQEYFMEAYPINDHTMQTDATICILDPLFRIGVDATIKLISTSEIIPDLELK